MDVSCGMLNLNYHLFRVHHVLHQKLKTATIDNVPEALHLPKRRDRNPVPVTQAMPPNPSHIAMTTNSTVTDSQHTPSHPGFAMHGFPPFSAPAFPMQYPMTNYPMTSMYMPPYGYPYISQGAQAMQPNGYPAPLFMMQNYPAPNYPMPPMYPPPSGYPFAMPAPQDANSSYGRNHQYSVSNAQASSDPFQNVFSIGRTQAVDEVAVPDTDPSICELIAAAERDPTPEP
jgi:hypothetical protein